MGRVYLKYVIRLLLISAVLALISVFYFKNNPDHYFSFYPYMFMLFVILPLLVFVFLVKMSTDMKKFPNHYMASMMIKFFFLAGLALYYKLTDGNNITSFLFSFFILYVVFQVYETTAILRYIKTKR